MDVRDSLSWGALALAISMLATPGLRHLGRRFGVLDVPNERSSHRQPTPRTGGIAIVLAVAVAFSASGALSKKSEALLLTSGLAIAVLGLVDDLRGLGAAPRLAVQAVLATAAVAGAGLVMKSLALPFVGDFAFGPVAAIISVFWIVGVTNAYNFMDGINGIASLEAVIAGLGLGAIAGANGDLAGATFALAVAGAAAGFLPWNFPSGSIFMGDVGSSSLGFWLALLVLRQTHRGDAFVAAALPLFPFLFDTTVTLALRIRRGEALLRPHRSHLYQRLNGLGWSHARVTALWGTLAAASTWLGVVYETLSESARLAGLVGALAAHSAVAIAITSQEAARGAPTRPSA